MMNYIAANCSLKDDECGHVFSIEMPVDALFNSMITAMTGVPSDFYCRQAFYAEKYSAMYDSMFGKWSHAVKTLTDENKFTFDGKKEVDADYICAEMLKRAAIAKNEGKKLKIVFIDHFHRMNFKSDSAMTYAMRDSVRKIKNTAALIGCAVVLLVQLNNRAEGSDPTSFHILDSSSIRHELQAFIGSRMYRQDGATHFGLFFDSQRYASIETVFTPLFMRLSNGVLSIDNNFIPAKDENNGH